MLTRLLIKDKKEMPFGKASLRARKALAVYCVTRNCIISQRSPLCNINIGRKVKKTSFGL